MSHGAPTHTQTFPLALTCAEKECGSKRTVLIRVEDKNGQTTEKTHFEAMGHIHLYPMQTNVYINQINFALLRKYICGSHCQRVL